MPEKHRIRRTWWQLRTATRVLWALPAVATLAQVTFWHSVAAQSAPRLEPDQGRALFERLVYASLPLR